MELNREILTKDGVAYVPLTQGYVAKIDADDVHLVAGRSWRAFVKRRPDGSILNVYAVSWKKTTKNNDAVDRMHRLIVGASYGEVVDHKDCDGLNNTRSNLRIATHSQNCANRRRAHASNNPSKGVTFNKSSKKWQAQISANGKSHYLGVYSDAADAAKAYEEASKRLFGEFARWTHK